MSQPYFSTRVNASEIDRRVKQLDQSIEPQSEEGGDKKIKAGFWEEFDVSVRFTTESSLLLLASLQGIGINQFFFHDGPLS